MAGRHGKTKGLFQNSCDEDMPFLEDGTPVDGVLNPLACHLHEPRTDLRNCFRMGRKELGVKFATPIFDGANVDEIEHYIES